ncbi:MAG: MFS transporter [Alphaproteobacteria bacterium]|nr:MFS transporter [Alphaproteobacteria bacterium]
MAAETLRPRVRRFPTAKPDGLVAAVLLSFLATAGFFYVNIMPALVAGLVEGLHYSQRQAGLVASANIYGAALGALGAVFAVRHIRWRPASVLLLLGLVVIEVMSTVVHTVPWMIAIRFVDGSIGGLLIGIAFGVIARTGVPDRVFGMLLVVQFGLGGLGVMVLPRLVPIFGVPVLFLTLALFSVVTLTMVPFLDDYPVQKTQPVVVADPSRRIAWGPLSLALLAVFLFQAGNMALAAYMIELGKGYGLNPDYVSTIIGIAAWIGAIGSLLVVAFGTRFGRFFPLAGALMLTVLGNAAFHFSASALIFGAANVGTAITWAFIIPYLLGMCAAFDTAGQSAAMGGFASHMGLATGPFIAATVIGGANYPLLIDVAVAALIVSTVAALAPARILDRVGRA